MFLFTHKRKKSMWPLHRSCFDYVFKKLGGRIDRGILITIRRLMNSNSLLNFVSVSFMSHTWIAVLKPITNKLWLHILIQIAIRQWSEIFSYTFLSDCRQFKNLTGPGFYKPSIKWVWDGQEPVAITKPPQTASVRCPEDARGGPRQHPEWHTLQVLLF